jgi:hypothetical protein
MRRPRTVVILLCSLALVGIGAATATASTPTAKAPVTEPAMRTQGDQAVVNGVAPFKDMWVAVGYDSKGDDEELAIWTAQGTPPGKWSRVPDDAFDGDLGVSLDADSSGVKTTTLLSSVYGQADQAVAAGYALQVHPDGGTSQTIPIAVTSDDGVSWHVNAVERSTDFNASGTCITYQSGTFVMGGSQQPADDSGSDGMVPAVWYSDDGATWTTADGLADSVTTSGAVNAVGRSAGNSPVFVAVGVTGDTDGTQHPAVWSSDDGATWTREPDSEAFGSGKTYQQEMDSVVGLSDNGFIAVGKESKNGTSIINGQALTFITPSHVVVWRSPDGLTWTRDKRNDPDFASGDKARPSVSASSIEAGEDFYVIVGYAEKAENKDTSPRVRAWSSTDAKKWEPLDFGSGTAAVDGQARAVETKGKYYEVVGVIGKNGNVWDGKD